MGKLKKVKSKKVKKASVWPVWLGLLGVVAVIWLGVVNAPVISVWITETIQGMMNSQK